jgi:hypothetical protein
MTQICSQSRNATVCAGRASRTTRPFRLRGGTEQTSARGRQARSNCRRAVPRTGRITRQSAKLGGLSNLARLQ